VGGCMIGDTSVDANDFTLVPGAVVNCSATYTVVQADIQAQQPIVNVVTAKADSPVGPVEKESNPEGASTSVAPLPIPVAPAPVAKVQTGGTVANGSSSLAGGLVILNMGLGLILIGIARRRRHNVTREVGNG